MKLRDIIATTGNLPYFDLATLAQFSNEPRASLRMQLSRLIKRGSLRALRRGMYVLGEPYRKATPNPALLANRIYAPSYLSFQWALGFYGLIPEKVMTYTSATPRVPRVFDNEFGRFQYRHIKPPCFAGYQAAEIDRQRVLIAAPEKALVDLWHIETGEWSADRMAGMRFQNVEQVSLKKLDSCVAMYRSPRLVRAARVWRAYVKSETKGWRSL